MEVKTVGVACDHAGYALKKFVLEYLEKKGYPYKDYGTWSDASVDYPDFGHALAEGIESGDLQVTLKKDQPIWAEWVAGEEDTAEDLNGYRYKLVNGVWYREEDMPVVSSAEEPDAA